VRGKKGVQKGSGNVETLKKKKRPLKGHRSNDQLKGGGGGERRAKRKVGKRQSLGSGSLLRKERYIRKTSVESRWERTLRQGQGKKVNRELTTTEE